MRAFFNFRGRTMLTSAAISPSLRLDTPTAAPELILAAGYRVGPMSAEQARRQIKPLLDSAGQDRAVVTFMEDKKYFLKVIDYRAGDPTPSAASGGLTLSYKKDGKVQTVPLDSSQNRRS